MASIAKSIFTGVDYIRLTSRDCESYTAWLDMLQAEFTAEDNSGRRAHYRWILGYYGRVGEHCFVGKGEQGSMLQLSGHIAWLLWYESCKYSRKCTRIDLQVTYPMDIEVDLYMHQCYIQGCASKSREGRKPKLEMWDTNSGVKMITIGSRQSELYGRMYDKYRESKEEFYRKCIRWEVEVKGSQAVDLCNWMWDNVEDATASRAIVHNFWAVRGMPPPWEVFEGMVTPEPIRRSKTDQSKLAWIATQVAPGIHELVKRGWSYGIAEAIASKSCSREEVEELSRAIANYCGD